MSAPDFTATLEAFSHARLEDFVRFVGRRLRERPDLRDALFSLTWPMLLGEYALLATRPDPEHEADV